MVLSANLSGCSLCFSSFLDHWAIQNIFLLQYWQRCKKASQPQKSIWRISYVILLISHWPKQVMWLSPKSLDCPWRSRERKWIFGNCSMPVFLLLQNVPQWTFFHLCPCAYLQEVIFNIYLEVDLLASGIHSSSNFLNIAKLVSGLDIIIYIFSKNVWIFSSAFLLTLGIDRLNFLANWLEWIIKSLWFYFAFH